MTITSVRSWCFRFLRGIDTDEDGVVTLPLLVAEALSASLPASAASVFSSALPASCLTFLLFSLLRMLSFLLALTL